jgi:hypothetical protein
MATLELFWPPQCREIKQKHGTAMSGQGSVGAALGPEMSDLEAGAKSNGLCHDEHRIFAWNIGIKESFHESSRLFAPSFS